MKYLSAIFLLSCVEFSQPFERDKFENKWWEVQEYSVCFNFHGSGDLLSYQDQELEKGEGGRFVDEGEWIFYEPNEYEFLEGDELISVTSNNDCWIIEGYSKLSPFTVCECTLR